MWFLSINQDVVHTNQHKYLFLKYRNLNSAFGFIIFFNVIKPLYVKLYNNYIFIQIWKNYCTFRYTISVCQNCKQKNVLQLKFHWLNFLSSFTFHSLDFTQTLNQYRMADSSLYFQNKKNFLYICNKHFNQPFLLLCTLSFLLQIRFSRNWYCLKHSYLWGSRCGGGPSTWHDLLCDITPALVGVSYSYLSGKICKH